MRRSEINQIENQCFITFPVARAEGSIPISNCFHRHPYCGVTLIVPVCEPSAWFEETFTVAWQPVECSALEQAPRVISKLMK